MPNVSVKYLYSVQFQDDPQAAGKKKAQQNFANQRTVQLHRLNSDEIGESLAGTGELGVWTLSRCK
jgi:hypothetical protein